LTKWKDISDNLHNHENGTVNIAVVGKYTVLPDAYKSITEALVHGGIANQVKVNIKWVEAEEFEKSEAVDVIVKMMCLILESVSVCKWPS